MYLHWPQTGDCADTTETSAANAAKDTAAFVMVVVVFLAVALETTGGKPKLKYPR